MLEKYLIYLKPGMPVLVLFAVLGGYFTFFFETPFQNPCVPCNGLACPYEGFCYRIYGLPLPTNDTLTGLAMLSYPLAFGFMAIDLAIWYLISCGIVIGYG
ncbi:MAG: hypothetical protein ABH863_04595, partial [Candidatus Micrarchaeota archaeon]